MNGTDNLEPGLDFYQDKTGDYRWRVVAANNQIGADSSEGYKNLADAHYGAGIALAILADAAGKIMAHHSELPKVEDSDVPSLEAFIDQRLNDPDGWVADRNEDGTYTTDRDTDDQQEWTHEEVLADITAAYEFQYGKKD
jgi:uncharacterized protein YegP (UPF0339 family)